MANDLIRHKLSLLPLEPGCYLMKNSEGTIIYVGKAKKLKNRVLLILMGYIIIRRLNWSVRLLILIIL